MSEVMTDSKMTDDEVVGLGLKAAFPAMRDIDEKLVLLPLAVKRQVLDLVTSGLGNQEGVPVNAIREVYAEHLRNPN